MIVQESDILVAALDRRLQVDATLPLGPLSALGGAADEADALVARTPFDAAPTVRAGQTSLAARMPLGRVVDARVVAATDDGQVTADIERWRVALAWPSGSSPLPRPGDDVRLRVLAHEPMLLFQNVEEAPLATDDSSVHWSRAALELSRQTGRAGASGAGTPTSSARRFNAPILDVSVSPIERRSEDAGASSIAVDDIVVGRGLSEMPEPTRPTNNATNAAATTPLVLQGPAWIGQPMELVVRRERADDELDNPVLDHWCGDIAIELPALGRVAGHLSLSMQGLRLRLEGEDAAAVATMTAGAPALAAAFGACDLRVATLSVGCLHPGAGGVEDF